MKALGSLSEKVVYTRLLRLREACKLSESFGLLVPENVNNEWRKYFHFSKVRDVCAVCVHARVFVSIYLCVLHVHKCYCSRISHFSASGAVR